MLLIREILNLSEKVVTSPSQSACRMPQQLTTFLRQKHEITSPFRASFTQTSVA